MDGRAIRHRIVGWFLVGALVAGGAAGCDSDSTEGDGATPPSSQKTRQQQGTPEQEDGGSENDEGPDVEPGWEVTVSGPVRAEVGGPSVLRKHAGTGGTKQVVLGGLPTGGDSSSNRMMFIVRDLSSRAGETYRPGTAEAYFGDVDLACAHSTGGDAGGETSLEVTFKRVGEAELYGTFEGTLRCESTEEDKEEADPMFVEVTGSFADL